MDAIGIARPRKLALEPEVIQVRDRFAHGEKSLVRIQFAPEQHWKQVRRGTRLCTGIEHFRQAVAMMVMQHLHAVVRAAERQAVRRQHQRIGGQFREAIDRHEE